MKINVLGAGVIGLTSSLVLARQGHDVTISAESVTPHTVSDVAAAFWYPYAAQPIEKVAKWAAHSFDRFQQMEADAATGIRKRRLIRYFQCDFQRPGYASVTEDYQEGVDALPPGTTHAISFNTFVIDMTMYMPYLMECCDKAGIEIREQALTSLDDVDANCDVVVNCTGLGAAKLVNDEQLLGAKGQVVRVRVTGKTPANVLIDESGHSHFTMIVPRCNDVVLGGTYEENPSSLGADSAEVERIVKDCQLICPELGQIEILESVSGLRPVRSEVRLERVQLNAEQLVIHNYGHGGAGVTLSWGCAAEVADLVDQRR